VPSRLISAVLICLCGLAPAAGRAQTPAGPEFHANNFGKNPQGYQSVGVSPGGDFLVAWQEITPDGKQDGLWSQWFSPPRSADLRLDPEIRFRGLQEVASDPAGNFLVVWQEGGAPPNGGWDIFGRLYHPDGTPFGPKVRLNQYVINDQTNAQVAAGPNGTFVVVWQSTSQDNGDDGIYGRVFAVPASGR
jgi:hypothetical protein